MSEITGKARRYDGSAIDYVLFFDWQSGACVGTTIPSAQGNWSFNYSKDLNVGITYVADGCEPITHGPYQFLADPFENGMILNYSFNGNIRDGSLSGLDGVLSGSADYTTGRKVGTQALRLTNAVVQTNAPLMINSDKLTVSCWLKMNDLTSAQVLFSGGSVGNDYGAYYVMANNTAAPSLDIITTSLEGAQTSTQRGLNGTDWHHFYFDIDRTASEITRLFVNNIKIPLEIRSQAMQPGDFINTVLNIGRSNSLYPYTGLIQDLRIYNRILTAEERTALFNE